MALISIIQIVVLALIELIVIIILFKCGNFEIKSEFDEIKEEEADGVDITLESSIMSIDSIANTDSKRDARESLIEIIKDSGKSISKIDFLLNSNDTELSHYSASVIQAELSAFNSSMVKSNLKLEEVSNGIGMSFSTLKAILDKYSLCDMLDETLSGQLKADISNEIVRLNANQEGYYWVLHKMQGLLNVGHDVLNSYFSLKLDSLGMTYRVVYIQSIENIYKLLYVFNSLELEELELLEQFMLKLGDYDKVQTVCEMAFILYPNSLESYKMRINFYFESKQYERFKEMLKSLTKTEIVLDSYVLNLVRLFC